MDRRIASNVGSLCANAHLLVSLLFSGSFAIGILLLLHIFTIAPLRRRKKPDSLFVRPLHLRNTASPPTEKGGEREAERQTLQHVAFIINTFWIVYLSVQNLFLRRGIVSSGLLELAHIMKVKPSQKVCHSKFEGNQTETQTLAHSFARSLADTMNGWATRNTFRLPAYLFSHILE